MALTFPLIHLWHHLIEPSVQPWSGSPREFLPHHPESVDQLTERNLLVDGGLFRLSVNLPLGLEMHRLKLLQAHVIKAGINPSAITRPASDHDVCRHARHWDATMDRVDRSVIPIGLQIFQRTDRGCLYRVEKVLHIIGHLVTGCRVRRVISPAPWLVCRSAGRRPGFAIIEYDADDMVVAGGGWLAEADER